MEYVDEPRQPVAVFRPLRSAPISRAFMFTCIGLFVAQMLVRVGAHKDLLTQYLSLDTQAVLGGQIWRVLTYELIHDTGTIFHILFNLLAFYFFAPAIEQALGARKFVIFLLAATIAPAAICLIAYPHVSVLGASGVVFAVLVAFILKWPRATVIFFIFPMPALYMGLILIGIELYSTFLSAVDQPSGIAHFAHLGGAAVGAIWVKMGPMLERIRSRRKVDSEANDELRADEILKKISARGIGSLSSRERKFLESYSRKRL
ncbi:MAG: rhomboid family intramembrane serine protease [Candidatus Brocadiia bacterium]